MKEYSFSELRNKRIVNVSDGRELGHLCDIVFSCTGRVNYFVAPGKKTFFKFSNNDCVCIPWNCIIKVGEDVILVELANRPSIMNTSDDDYTQETAYAQNNNVQNN
ncbi:MAG: YlmC/YmxH family sporulation protein [Christensenellales bacterium]